MFSKITDANILWHSNPTSRNVFYRPQLPSLGAINILGWIILCCEFVLCIVGYLTSPALPTKANSTPFPSYDNQKFPDIASGGQYCPWLRHIHTYRKRDTYTVIHSSLFVMTKKLETDWMSIKIVFLSIQQNIMQPPPKKRIKKPLAYQYRLSFKKYC